MAGSLGVLARSGPVQGIAQNDSNVRTLVVREVFSAANGDVLSNIAAECHTPKHGILNAHPLASKLC